MEKYLVYGAIVDANNTIHFWRDDEYSAIRLDSGLVSFQPCSVDVYLVKDATRIYMLRINSKPGNEAVLDAGLTCVENQFEGRHFILWDMTEIICNQLECDVSDVQVLAHTFAIFAHSKTKLLLCDLNTNGSVKKSVVYDMCVESICFDDTAIYWLSGNHIHVIRLNLSMKNCRPIALTSHVKKMVGVNTGVFTLCCDGTLYYGNAKALTNIVDIDSILNRDLLIYQTDTDETFGVSCRRDAICDPVYIGKCDWFRTTVYDAALVTGKTIEIFYKPYGSSEFVRRINETFPCEIDSLMLLPNEAMLTLKDRSVHRINNKDKKAARDEYFDRWPIAVKNARMKSATKR